MFSTRNYLAFVFFLTVMASLSACSGSTQKPPAQTTTAPSTPESVAQVKELKDFELQMFTENGALTPMKLSEAVGRGNVVIIDFWATWCGPCRRSIPDLVAVQNEYRAKGVQVFGLSSEDPAQTKDLVASTAKDLKVNYKVGFVPRDMFLSFTNSGSIPQCFIFGKDGKLVKHLIGFHPEMTPRMLRANIDKALES